MRRRQFIAGLGSAAVWPAVARAQQGARTRRIGVLIGDPAENDPTGIAYVSAERRGGEPILETGYAVLRQVTLLMAMAYGVYQVAIGLSFKLFWIVAIRIQPDTPSGIALPLSNEIRCRRIGFRECSWRRECAQPTDSRWRVWRFGGMMKVD
jgi:hypothetical protein